jgi:Uma2 family endonuclease
MVLRGRSAARWPGGLEEEFMATTTGVEGYTFEEFCLLSKDGEKADLIDGVIHVASPENTDAARLATWLGGLIDLFVETHDLGQVFVSPRVAFRLAPRQAPEPDLAFVRKGRLRRVRRGYVDGPPDVAVEIVSPDSVERDYVHKREQYRRARVPEYWIIDEMLERVTWLRLNAAGAYRGVRPRDGVLHSRALPGFWLRPDWLWQEPRPKKADVLAEILRG